jgi:hypothetical protein
MDAKPLKKFMPEIAAAKAAAKLDAFVADYLSPRV